MPTIKDQIDKLTELKHRRAVWEAITTYLDDNFLSKDGRAAPKALKVPDCLVELVPESTVESVMQALGEGPLLELGQSIEAIENQEVVIVPGGKRNEEAAS
jgi:hypothetical protein